MSEETIGAAADGYKGPSKAMAGDLVKEGAHNAVKSGVAKATGSTVAADAVDGARRLKDGDIVGGAQTVAASAASAGVTAVVTSTGVGAPVANVAGTVAGKAVKSKAGRLLIVAVTALTVMTLVVQAAIVSAAVLGAVSAMSAAVSATQNSSHHCPDGPGAGLGVGDVVGDGVQEKIWNLLRAAGYDEVQVAGIMGNIAHESGYNPFRAESDTAHPMLERGWGLVQWTAGRHIAIRDAVTSDPQFGPKFYKASPTPTTFPEGFTEDEIDRFILFQVQYILMELNGPEKAADRNLRQATTIEGASTIFEKQYERPAPGSTGERIQAAHEAYSRFSGSAVPESATSDVGDLPTPTGMEWAGANVGENAMGTGGCASGGPMGSVEAGAVKPGPNGEDVNIPYITQPSEHMICPPGTTDRGVQQGYYLQKPIMIRLCSPDGYLDVRGDPILVNVTVAANFKAFLDDLKQQGVPAQISSHFRTAAHQASLGGSSNVAAVGMSNHQTGTAVDISGLGIGYNRFNCGGAAPDGSCITPTPSEQDRWWKIHRTGLKYGMYFHDQEFWHIEFTPSGTSRGRTELISMHLG